MYGILQSNSLVSCHYSSSFRRFQFHSGTNARTGMSFQFQYSRSPNLADFRLTGERKMNSRRICHYPNTSAASFIKIQREFSPLSESVIRDSVSHIRILSIQVCNTWQTDATHMSKRFRDEQRSLLASFPKIRLKRNADGTRTFLAFEFRASVDLVTFALQFACIKHLSICSQY